MISGSGRPWRSRPPHTGLRGLTALAGAQRQVPELLQQVLSGFGSLAASVGLSSSKVPSSPLSLTRLTVFSSRATPPVAGSGRLLPWRSFPGLVRRPRPCSPRPAGVPARPFRQQGPYGPPELTAPSHLFRTVLLRRLRLPLPVTENTCRCHRRLDPPGDHRAACSTSRVLRSRGCGLERAASRG